jgi:hypothetical protein
MTAQLITTDLCAEAVVGFADLLKGRASGTRGDDYFARDWSPLWDELVRDGWTVIADPPDSEFSLYDLTAFAQVWARYLVPLPFIATLTVRRALDVKAAPEARLAGPAGRPGSDQRRVDPGSGPGRNRRLGRLGPPRAAPGQRQPGAGRSAGRRGHPGYR